ncbi:MAG: dihydroorotate dehydrogenase [Gammaproteobacteria bacterium]|jgi:dihydroorotate dehydrogenase
MDVYSRLVRPLLFRLTADHAHYLARIALRFAPVWRAVGYRSRFNSPRLKTSMARLRLANPIGLAPGLDKDGQFVPALSQLGFGYLVVGSITRNPRPGNPFPRLIRYPEEQAIANCMGLPNKGLKKAIHTLSQRPATPSVVVGSVAGSSRDELYECAEGIEPYVDAVEIGLVCPNATAEERVEELHIFTDLAESLVARRRKPLFFKLPPYFDDDGRRRAMMMLDVCLRTGVDGISIAGNTSIEEPRLSTGQGSLSGRPAMPDILRITRDFVPRCRGKLFLRVSGGVFTGSDAFELLRAGADAVELYTAFIYRGWNAAGLIAGELDAAMQAAGISELADIHGS